jgi:RNA polymerase sigma-70 factor (ECF subfamily)
LSVKQRRPSVRERSNEQWQAELRGPERDRALADLRGVLVRGLRVALAGRVRQGLNEAAEDFAQEALIKIMANLDTFRGESRFTTWAQKIAVMTASTELRRKRWRDVSLQEVLDRYGTNRGESDRLADERPTPERLAMHSTMVATVRRFVDEELTERQREAIVAVMFEGMPLEETARRMGTNRGALYKLMHDARRRLKKRMEAEGLSAQDVLGSIGEG